MTLNHLFIVLLARWRAVVSMMMLCSGLAIAVSFLSQKSYTSTTSVIVDFKGVDPLTGLTVPGQLLTGYMGTQTDIITSHNVALKVVDILKLNESPEEIEKFNRSGFGGSIRDWLANGLVSYLDIKPSRDSSVLNISYTHKDSQRSADFANAFAKAYVQVSLELKVDPARNEAEWFEEQTKTLRAKEEEAQRLLSEYQQKTRMLAPEERVDVESARLAELSSQLVVAQSQTYESETKLRHGSNSSTESVNGSEEPDILANSLIQNLKSELARAEAKFAEMSEGIGSNHPQLQGAKAEVESIKRKLAAEIQTARGSIRKIASQARQREAEIEKALNEQKDKVLKFKEQRDKIALLSREVANAQHAYDAARQHADQIRLESKRSQTEIAVLNWAIAPTTPSKPRKALNIAIGSILGLLLGLGLGLLLEVMDRRVRVESDLTEELGIPVLVSLKLPKRDSSKGTKGWFNLTSTGASS